MVGHSLSLECKVDSSPVKPSVTWIPPEGSDCNPKQYNTKTVTITAVSRCHSGVWTCKLEYGNKRKTEATTTVSVIGETNVSLSLSIYEYRSTLHKKHTQ